MNSYVYDSDLIYSHNDKPLSSSDMENIFNLSNGHTIFANGGFTINMGHTAIFKQVSITCPDLKSFERLQDQTKGKLCLHIDDKLSPGSCNPKIDSTDFKQSWEDYQMQLENHVFNEIKIACPHRFEIYYLEVSFLETKYLKSHVKENADSVIKGDIGSYVDCGSQPSIGVFFSSKNSFIKCGSWDENETLVPKKIELETQVAGDNGNFVMCPWGYVLKSACSSSNAASCDGKFSKIDCVKITDVEIDGHDSNIVIDVIEDDFECPKNYIVTGFCWSNDNSCDGQMGSIVCSPIKFHECMNTDDIIDNNIDIEYRMTAHQTHLIDAHWNNKKMSIWKAEFYQEGVCALGDVISNGHSPVKNMHVLVRALSKTALKPPKALQRLSSQPSGHITGYRLVPENGYVCLGDVFKDNTDRDQIDKSKYCCVRKDLTVSAEKHSNGYWNFAVRKQHDTQGLLAGLAFHNKPTDSQRMRLLNVDNVNVRSSFEMKGPEDRPIKLYEAEANLVATIEDFSVWRASIGRIEIKL